MAWREDAEQGFPPQRHQEPFTLRTDILDELADHLALAAEREAEAGAKNEHEIRTRVLTKFGNPSAIAHSLWWGAMKEIIVKDWIQISINAILCIGVIVFMGLFYQQMQSSNTALLNALNERSATPENQDPSVEFILHRGSLDGPAVEGVYFSLRGHLLNEEEIMIHEKPDSQGRVLFGPIRAGRHSALVHDPISDMTFFKSITLYSGSDTKIIHIIFPPESPRPLNVSLPFDPQIVDEDLLIMMSMEQKLDHGDGQWLEYSGPPFRSSYKPQIVIVTSEGIFKTRKSLSNDKWLQVGEKITQVFGNKLLFSNVGILNSVPSDNENENERWYSTLRSKKLDGIARSYSFSHTLKENNNEPIVLNLPEELEEVYAYHIRLKTNEDHGLPERFSWFPEVIAEKYEEYVIDEARLVEQSRLKETREDGYTLYNSKRGATYNVLDKTGQVFSLKNAPRSIPQGYKLLLVLDRPRQSIRDLNVNLCAYLDFTPTSHEYGHHDDKFRETGEAIWKLRAGDIDSHWRRFAFIDMTNAVNDMKTFKDATGVLVKWETPSSNSLDINAPEKKGDNGQPVWLIMKPVDGGV